MLRRLNGVPALILGGLRYGIETIAKANDETVEIIIRDYRVRLGELGRSEEDINRDIEELRESIRRVRQGLDPCWR